MKAARLASITGAADAGNIGRRREIVRAVQ
jgi:hypothetical protein